MKYSISSRLKGTVDSKEVIVEKESIVLDKRLTVSSSNIPWLYTRMLSLMYRLSNQSSEVLYKAYLLYTDTGYSFSTVDIQKELPELSKEEIEECFKELCEAKLFIHNEQYPMLYRYNLELIWSAKDEYLAGKKAKIIFKIE